MMSLAMIGALGKMTEWEIHCRGALNNGVSVEEIRTIIHTWLPFTVAYRSRWSASV